MQLENRTAIVAGGAVYAGGAGQARRRPGTDDSVVQGEVVNE